MPLPAGEYHLELGGKLRLDPGWIEAREADALFDELRANVAWAQGSITLFGREVPEPRLSAWFGDGDYTYSGRTVRAALWPAWLASLRGRVERAAGAALNAVLLNFYRDGKDSMGMHSDDEPELGENPTIASVSFGVTRTFVLAPKKKSARHMPSYELALGHGSLLVMSGSCQHHYRHGVPKQRGCRGARINLTFRGIRSGGLVPQGASSRSPSVLPSGPRTRSKLLGHGESARARPSGRLEGSRRLVLNRLVIFEQIADAFRKVFREDLQLVYEISHNLVQAEHHPAYGEVWVHRKGATRAFPGGHQALVGTIWQDTGHPVLIPGSNRDHSYVLMPEAGAAKSAYSVNHGAGRRMSRGEAMRQLDRRKIDEQYRRDGILVNLDGRVPIDESAQCYKSCEEVVSAVVAAGLARVEHTLWPLASIKGSEEGAARLQQRERKGRDRSREKQRDVERGVARKTKGQY